MLAMLSFGVFVFAIKWHLMRVQAQMVQNRNAEQMSLNSELRDK